MKELNMFSQKSVCVCVCVCACVLALVFHHLCSHSPCQQGCMMIKELNSNAANKTTAGLKDVQRQLREFEDF